MSADGAIWAFIEDHGAIQRATTLLENIPSGIQNAMYDAMKKTASVVRRETGRAISERYDIAVSDLRLEKDRIVNVQCFTTKQGIRAAITYRGVKIPLYRFGGTYPKYPTQNIAAGKLPVKTQNGWTRQYPGVAARAHQLRGTAPKQFADAFTARMKSGHIGIFRRTGGVTSEGNDQIQELMGSSVPQMVASKDVSQRLKAQATQTFETELDAAVYRILAGGR